MGNKIVKWIVLIYGIVCIGATVFFANRAYYQTLVNNAPFYVNNRNYVMGLFFKKWDDINNTYDPLWSNDKTPRWYKKALEPTFQAVPVEFQKAQAEEYIRQYVKYSMGIDHRKVEGWLFNIINLVNNGLFTYKDIFGTPYNEHNLHRDTYEHQLRQIVTFLPAISKWYAFKENLGFTLSVFPVIMGLPLLLIQIIFWISALIRKRKLTFIYLTKKSMKVIFWISITIGLIYLTKGLISEYKNAAVVNFVEGKWYHIKIGLLYFPVAFILSFLGLWGLATIFGLTKQDIMSLKIIKRSHHDQEDVSY